MKKRISIETWGPHDQPSPMGWSVADDGGWIDVVGFPSENAALDYAKRINGVPDELEPVSTEGTLHPGNLYVFEVELSPATGVL